MDIYAQYDRHLTGFSSRAPCPCGLIRHVICRIKSEDRGIETRRQLENRSKRPSDAQEIRDEFGNERRHARETNDHRRVERARSLLSILSS